MNKLQFVFLCVSLSVAMAGWRTSVLAQFGDGELIMVDEFTGPFADRVSRPPQNTKPGGNATRAVADQSVDAGRQYQMARNVLRKSLPCKNCKGEPQRPCPRCKGKEGRSRCTAGCGGTGVFTCGTCKGSGITLAGTVALLEFKEELSGGTKYALSDCEICDGSGKIEKHCHRCGGSGYQITKECDQCQRYGASTGLGVRPNCPTCIKGSSRCQYCRHSPGKSSKGCDRCTGKKLLEKYLK